MTRAVTPSLPEQRGTSAPRSPYVGLVPFDEADAAFFFGRRREIKLLAGNLAASRLTLLYAPSGVGKTSVLRAGLVPYLEELATEIDEDIEEERGSPVTVYIRDWSGSPAAAVISAVTAALEERNGVEPECLPELRQAPTIDVSWLTQVLRVANARGLYLILDQFEEFLLYHPGEWDDDSLVVALGDALRDRDLRVNVLVAIREDALAQLDRLKGTVPHLFDNYLRLSHLARGEAREAIVAPLEAYNRAVPQDARIEIEPALVEKILDEVQVGRLSVEEADAAGTVEGAPAASHRRDIETPFLQLVLVRMWAEEQQAGSNVLRADTLRRLGGARTIVQGHLDMVLGGLDEDKQDLAALVLRQLVTAGGMKIALGVEDLAELTGAEPNEIDDLVRILSRGPRSILRPLPPVAPGGGPTLYEIFHDVLGSAILAWRRRRLAEVERRRTETALAEERREAQELVATTRRRLRRVSLFALVMVVAVLIVSVLAIVAWTQYRNAQANQDLAEAATAPDGGLREAVAAYNIRHDQTTRDAVLRAASAPQGRVTAGPEIRAGTLLPQPGGREAVVGLTGNMVALAADGAHVGGATVAGMAGQVYSADTSADGDDVAVVDSAGQAHVVSLGGHHPQVELGGFPASSTIQFLEGAQSDRVMVTSYNGGVVIAPASGIGPRVSLPGSFLQATRTTDGEHVVTAGPDHVLRAWDANGTMVAASPPLPGSVSYLQPYRNNVVGLDLNGSSQAIFNWDWRTNAGPGVFPLASSPGELNNFHVDDASGTVTLTAGRYAEVYSADRVVVAPTATAEQPVDLYDAVVSPDSRWVATAGGDGRILIWARSSSTSLDAPTFILSGHRGRITSLLWDEDSHGLSSVGVDGTARRWTLPNDQRFIGHTNSITDMDVSGDSRWVATASADGTVMVSPVDRFAGPSATTLVPNTPNLLVNFDPKHADRVFTVDRESWAPQVWAWSPGAPVPAPRTLDQAPNSAIFTAMAVSPDGRVVAVGDTAGHVFIWDTVSGHLVGPPLGVANRNDRQGSPATSIAFDPRGELLAVAGGDGINLWRRLADGLYLPGPRFDLVNAASVTFNGDGRYIVASSSDGRVQAWQRDGRPWGAGPIDVGGDTQGAPAVSADGRYVAIGSTSGTVEVLDIPSGHLVETARENGTASTGTLFVGTDDSRIVSAGSDNATTLWTCAACRDPDGYLRNLIASQADG